LDVKYNFIYCTYRLSV